MRLRGNCLVCPDASQCRALARAFGCAGVVWNDCLRDRKEAHAAGLPYVKSVERSRLRITQAERTEESPSPDVGPGARQPGVDRVTGDCGGDPGPCARCRACSCRSSGP
ncbi:helix-turn-helix domain-containing protein [Streptomyces massasporeus]|uniref:helix-turn-helix domain-containing protein n=1 Tax=Streptomyces massasporeus TaxID=67324 RepID=UPI0037FF4AD9